MANEIYVVGNKVEIPPSNKLNPHMSTDIITFVGKMDYEPNVVAVSYFADRIFPSLKRQFPTLSFYIVGIRPDERVLKLSDIEGVVVTGYVEDLAGYYKDATIVVAPMLSGAGIQNKILQAMACGCCVVTTSIGAEGLNITKGEIKIFDNDNEMIAGITNLLNNRDERIKLGYSAREYVIENLSPEVIEKQFWEFIGDDYNS